MEDEVRAQPLVVDDELEGKYLSYVLNFELIFLHFLSFWGDVIAGLSIEELKARLRSQQQEISRLKQDAKEGMQHSILRYFLSSYCVYHQSHLFCFFHNALLSPLWLANLKHFRVFVYYRVDEEEQVVKVSAGSAGWQNFFDIAKVPLMISRVEDNAPIRVNDAFSTYVGLSKEDIYATGSSFCVSFKAKPIANSPVRFRCPPISIPFYFIFLPAYIFPLLLPSACPYASFLSNAFRGFLRTLSG